MKRNLIVVSALALGFFLGNIAPGLVKAAPRIGDAKFESQFIKAWAPSAEKPITLRTSGGGEYQITGIGNVEDDFISFQTKSGALFVRTKEITSVQVP